MLDDLYRQLIMDHTRRKRNYREMKDGDFVHYKNPTCGDVMTLFWKWNDNGTLEDVSFIGEGCSISMASCSMMTELAKGKSYHEIVALREGMERLIRHEEEPDEFDLDDALSLAGVHRLRARHNCALMPWQAMDRAFLDT
ncbi:SUF system NifU family Fe-S cluster assembly protein [Salipaludibacillus keqinensis]|uniref:SUF system NifU family Fe-S cluster assembly protein n=1 Tax=Salipaludibacillus keqinensis TaxID=2045207 RepID=A0A323TD29_9BACI|nr:SUF system NifU family Fe-S cluster assembly protein [Salipaludibacillus keqinensis]PYZ92536.1 SUF system NifU family Fe-S cluster assembly protein [Salipaludibacillus keqinensis]